MESFYNAIKFVKARWVTCLAFVFTEVKPMDEKETIFLPYEEAARIVAAIQEEEDIHRKNKRILTVYNQDDKEICWFDFEEVMNDIGAVPAGEKTAAVQDYVIKRIPRWALDL